MINVTLGEVNTQDVKPFPKLMKYEYAMGSIIIAFFPSEKKGVILNVIKKGKGECCDQIGDFIQDNWDNTEISYFTDYNEPITIQNA